MSEDTPDLLPRPALREPAFRQFEAIMVRAVNGPLTLHASELDGRAPRSWIVLFNEARKGFLDYGYKSSLDPVAVARLQGLETADGGVHVRMRTRGRGTDRLRLQVAASPPVAPALDWTRARDRIVGLLAQVKEDPTFLERHGEIIIQAANEEELRDVALYCAAHGVLYPLTDYKRKIVVVPVV